MQWENPGCGVRQALGPPLVRCVTLGRIWALSELQFANLYNRERVISDSQITLRYQRGGEEPGRVPSDFPLVRAHASLGFKRVMGSSRNPTCWGILMTAACFTIHLFSVCGAMPHAGCWGHGNKATCLVLKELTIACSRACPLTHTHSTSPLLRLFSGGVVRAPVDAALGDSDKRVIEVRPGP